MREARKSIQLTKKIMRDLGLPGGFERPPLLPLTGEEELMASKVKQQMGLGDNSATTKVIASISVSGPSQRVTAARIEEVAPLVMERAAEISRRLGYKP